MKMISLFCIIVIIAINAESSRLLLVDNCATTGCGICFQCNPNSGKCTEKYDCCLNHYGCNGNKICINRRCNEETKFVSTDLPNPDVVKCGFKNTCYNGEIHVQIIQLINQHQNVMVMDKHV
eukprot:48930_1